MATINQPQRRESDLDIVLKGLQAIGGIMDIKKTYEEGQRLKAMQEQEQAATQAQAAELDRKRANKLYAGEITSLLGDKKIVPVPEGATGDISIMEQRAPGEIGVAETPRTFMSQGAYEQYASTLKKPEDSFKEDEKKWKIEDRRIQEEERKNKEIDRLNTELKEAAKEFNQKPIVRESIDNYSRAKLVDDLLAKGTSDAIAIAQRQMYRMSGDVGAIRAEDVTDLSENPSLFERGRTMLLSAAKGEKITPEMVKDMRNTLNVMQKHYKKLAYKQGQSFAKARAAQIRGANEQDVFNGMGIDEMLNSDFELKSQQLKKEIIMDERTRLQQEKDRLLNLKGRP